MWPKQAQQAVHEVLFIPTALVSLQQLEDLRLIVDHHLCKKNESESIYYFMRFIVLY